MRPNDTPMVFSDADRARFWTHVDTSGECWLWRGHHTTKGYGGFWLNGRTVLAHRAASAMAYGPLPPATLVCHNCPGGDTPACVRPDHLWRGDQLQNRQDAVRKGRTARGARQGMNTHPEARPRGEHHGCAVLTEAQVREIRFRAAAGAAHKALGREYGVSDMQIRRIVRREAWRHI